MHCTPNGGATATKSRCVFFFDPATYLARATDHDSGCIMASPKEYRERADECLGQAAVATSDMEQRLLLQRAEAWLEAAVRADRKSNQALENKTAITLRR